MSRLFNKTAMITGGSGEIGIAIAKLFVQEGARVIITDLQEEAGRKLEQEMDIHFIPMNVSNELDWKRTIKTIKQEYKHLDILINNAGIFGFNETQSPQNPEFMNLKDWHKIHHVNLDSVFLGCKYAIVLMKKQGGSIINMSSRAGFIGVPSAAAYASSKAAIWNYTKSVALYCAEKQYKIRCNSLHPGIIKTEFWSPVLKTNQYTTEDMQSIIPMGTLGSPHDVACSAVFLASDESKYMTGAEITIDGGLSAGRVGNPVPAD